MTENDGKRAGAYQVLARKYRPQNFDDLIGHQAMVRTLRNAFSTGRIAHAWVLTGVRGVGKTTTARILARALNYVGPDGEDSGPTVDLAVEGRHCRAIAESRHPDVMEMDAASRTGVSDIRELIEGVRYAPVEARYKVYIIDEVHMLSTAAFNALLKTLEEPPAHVKFVFATTEIRKLPVTVLSRCQRFDLRRIDEETLAAHLAAIAAKEGGEVEAEGLAMIARAAEGSVRDALSILDQALLQHAAGGGAAVTSDSVREMLGLADRTMVWNLLRASLSGDAAAAIGMFAAQYDAGAEPATVMRDLLETTHLATRVKAVGPAAAADGVAGEADAARARALAEALPMNALTRAWSLLMKGLQETMTAPDPAAAAEMALIRLAYAADLPTPDEALRLLAKGAGHSSAQGGAKLDGGGAGRSPQASGSRGGASLKIAARSEPAPRAMQTAPAPAAPRFATFEAVVRHAEAVRDMKLKVELETYVRLVSFAERRITLALVDGAPQDLPGRLLQRLKDWTGENWAVAVEAGADGAAPIRDQRLAEVMANPIVRRTFELFPKAEIMGVYDAPPSGPSTAIRVRSGGAAPGAASVDEPPPDRFGPNDHAPDDYAWDDAAAIDDIMNEDD